MSAAAKAVLQRSAHSFFTSLITLTPSQPHTASVIFMHGLGDTADGWAGSVQSELAPALPFVKFILPTAPRSPVTLNGGMKMTSWHDITDLHSIDSDPPTGLAESVRAVHALIDKEIEAGVPASRIMVAGFSQGGAMSLRTGLTYPHALAGIMPCSGYLPGRQTFAPELHAANKNTPLHAFHGDADHVVEIDFIRLALRSLREMGVTFGAAAPVAADAPLPLNVYRHMGHSASEKELKDMVQFMLRCLPPRVDAAAGGAAKADL